MALARPGGREAPARAGSARTSACGRASAPLGTLALACALALGARGTRAEAVAFSGKVVDQIGNPLPWALLAIAGTTVAGQSQADGTFSLSGDIPTGLFGSISSSPGPVPAPFAARYRADGRVLGLGAEGNPAGYQVTLTSPHARSSRADGPVASAPSLSETARSAPAAARIAAGWTLSVSMARFQDGSFPQAASPAKGLVLALTPSATDTAVYASEKQACLDTLNALRAGIGKPKLAWSKSLEAFADQGARYDAQRDSAHAHFRAYSKSAVPADAEDAIPGWPLKSYKTVAAVVYAGAKMMWDEGPGGGHYQNIAGDQKEVGCGIYVTPQGGVWILHDFK